MIKVLKQIAVFLLAALIVFLLFYNCTGQKKEENKETFSSKKDSVIVNSQFTNNCKTYFEKAREMDNIIMNSTVVNREIGEQAIKAFSDFSFYCKNDTLAPMFLIKAAQIAQSINNLPQAKVSLEKCIQDFPNFKDRGAAMFLLAQLYDEPQFLNDERIADEMYKEIVEWYPGTEWARNAAAARQLIGKTDEEIVREFEKKNKGK